MTGDLKSLRNKAQLTQKETAKYLGISLRSYQSYENEEAKKNTLKYEYLVDKLEGLTYIDENTGILSLDQIIDITKEIFAKYPVDYAYIFGSYAKGKQTETSDIDLLISSELKGLDFYGLVEDLNQALRKSVDLLDLNQVVNNKDLLDQILKDGIKIYGQ